MKPRTRGPAMPGGPRLTAAELFYLRWISQGLDRGEAARRFLGVTHGHAFEPAHRFVLERAQAIARRRGNPRWRLLGALIPAKPDAAPAAPSVEEWAAAEGLTDWSWQELLEMHAEQFGSPAADPRRSRILARNARLLRLRLQLLDELQAEHPAPRPTDAVDGWLAPRLVLALHRCGVVTLQDLRDRIAVGGRWWHILPAYGPTKAARLAAHLDALLGPPAVAAGPRAWRLDAALAALDALERAPGENRLAPQPGGTKAANDRAARVAWLDAKATSAATRASYGREAERFILWLALTASADLARVTADHCVAYKAFLADVPVGWYSRRGAAHLAPGWAPFRGPLRIASQQLALTVVSAFFAWLVEARYLGTNPWALVNKRLGDDPHAETLDDPTSRAFTPSAWAALQAELAAETARSPESGARLQWLLTFCSSTGLRIAEVIRATRKDLRHGRHGWTMHVFGKGRRRREVIVTADAIAATRAYFVARGLDLDAAAPDTLLLAPADVAAQLMWRRRLYERACAAALAGGQPRPPEPRWDVPEPMSYTAMRATLRALARRAASRLPLAERDQLNRATLHWMRHTFGTRAAEAGVAANDIQEQLGQADPRTAARYCRAQIEHRAKALEKLRL